MIVIRQAIKLILSVALTTMVSSVLLWVQVVPASAQISCGGDSDFFCPPPVTDGGTSAGSINSVANQQFNQMITNQVLGSVLLGVNEQVNCSDCVSTLGSGCLFTARLYGRKERH